MALPIFYPFKTKYLYASSTSTGGAIITTTVPARAKYVGAWFATSPTIAQTATNSAVIAVNGTAFVTGSVSSSTGNSATQLAAPTTAVFLAAGDVLSITLSSCVGGVATFVIQEF